MEKEKWCMKSGRRQVKRTDLSVFTIIYKPLITERMICYLYV